MITHPKTGHLIDPEGGVVYGKRGVPIGAVDAKGYLHIGHRENGKQFGLLAHRLIWEAAKGEIPKGMTINHKNAIKHDNRLANLEVVTHSDNIAHAKSMGLLRDGSRHPQARLTEADIQAIRSRHAAGEAQGALAKEFSVGKKHIYQITSGRRWAKADIIGGE